MSDTENQSKESVEDDFGKFRDIYKKVLNELDILHRGVYDSDEGLQTAALCLLAQAALISLQAEADFRARALKRDIDFKKAEVYSKAKETKGSDGKRITDATAQNLVNEDEGVHKLYNEQNKAEKEAKELANILALLKDAHLTFRSLAKRGE